MRRQMLVGFALCAMIASSRVARAACGDGVLDAGEACDDGAMNGHDACCSASCTLVDSDGDGICDALDACPGLDIRLKDTTLAVARVPSQVSGDRLRFTGTMTIQSAPPIDPASSGMRLQMYDSDGFAPRTAVLDASLSGGPNWHADPRGKGWTYRDSSGEVAGITRVTVQLLPPLVPSDKLTKVKFSILGRRGSYPLTPAMVTSAIENGLPTGNGLLVSLAMGAPVAASGEQCGNVVYTTVLDRHCTFARHGNVVSCAGPRPVGPCHTGDPDNLVVCDLLDGAHAEENYFAGHGQYFSGDCKDLPGFVPSPGVICTVAGDALDFTASASHALAIQSCVWRGHPPVGQANLVCS